MHASQLIYSNCHFNFYVIETEKCPILSEIFILHKEFETICFDMGLAG